MSDPSRQRLIRAVRLLPGSVRIGKGVLEDVGPDSGAVAVENQPKSEELALAAAHSEIRTLRTELRGKDEEIVELRGRLQSIQQQMDDLKAQLEQERAQLHETAMAEAAEAKAKAETVGHEEGHAKGYAEGLKAAADEVRSDYEGRFSHALSLLESIYQGLSAERANLAEGHATQMIRIWELMLQKMLQAHVEIDPAVVQRMLQYILTRVSDREKILIYLNPEDIAMIESGKEQIMDGIRGVKIFELLSDDYVEKGSCLIETNLGIYDARWKTQLEQISAEVGNLILESMIKDDAGNAAGDD